MNNSNTLSLGDLMINRASREVIRRGAKITLRKKEYELLEFLARNCEKVINRLTILEYVWNYSAQISTNTVEVHMVSLRRKIDNKFPVKLIRTIHGMGYKLSLKND